MKCQKCKYFYRIMSTGSGYNPFPCCHLFDETGKRPNVLTQECFEKRKSISELRKQIKDPNISREERDKLMEQLYKNIEVTIK